MDVASDRTARRGENVSGWLQIIMGYMGYFVCLFIVAFVVVGFMSIWDSRLDKREEEQDEPEVRAFREQLDTWDSALFLEDADIRGEG